MDRVMGKRMERGVDAHIDRRENEVIQRDGEIEKEEFESD